MFITFEGTEGSGKSTQAKQLLAFLRDSGYDVILTHEPGGTDIGLQIREILLNNMNNTMMDARAELLLFCASRAQLIAEVIQPVLQRGGIVICDRYADSTLAYQGYGHGLKITDLKRILNFATSGLTPDLTLYLDLDPEVGLNRRRAATLFGEDWNRLDDMELDFHKRVYKGYEKIIKSDPKRWLRVNADQPQEQVWDDLYATLLPYLPKPERS